MGWWEEGEQDIEQGKERQTRPAQHHHSIVESTYREEREMEKAGRGVDESESYSASSSNDCGAFIQRFQLYPPTRVPVTTLPLRGLTFAIKDM